MAESARILGLCFLFWCVALPPLAAEAQQPCSSDDLLAGAQPFAQTGTRGDVALLTDQRTPADGARWDAPEKDNLAFWHCCHATIATFGRGATTP
jgi:hypothetical protein